MQANRVQQTPLLTTATWHGCRKSWLEVDNTLSLDIRLVHSGCGIAALWHVWQVVGGPSARLPSVYRAVP
eukprot:1224397-Lingulodinium_polyedra.AAC.1